MDEVVLDDVAAPGPVAAGVEDARVNRFEHDVMDLVRLDDVVVAVAADGLVRRIVDEVVDDAMAATIEPDGGLVDLLLWSQTGLTLRRYG